jgi:hypothetical protein
LQGGDVNPGVDEDWYARASERLCDLGIYLVSCNVNIQKWKVAFFFFFQHETNILVKSNEVIQKFCHPFLAMGLTTKV